MFRTFPFDLFGRRIGVQAAFEAAGRRHDRYPAADGDSLPYRITDRA